MRWESLLRPRAADGDGDSDGNDFLTWKRNLGATVFALPSTTLIPEPAAGALLAAALSALVAARRR
jgi:hypothetical protein